MRRREFIAGVGASALAAGSIGVSAQERTATIGYLATGSEGDAPELVRAFHQGLIEMGFTPGNNVSIEYRWAQDDRERLPALATELVRKGVNVIAATGGSPAALAAKAITSSIPIVFQIGVDPVRAGLVSSLSRPNGNVTGVTILAVDLNGKRVQLLHELVSASTIAALVNPNRAIFSTVIGDLRAAADALDVRLLVVNATSAADFESAVSAAAKQSRALVIGSDPLFNSHGAELGALTARYRLPAIYQSRPFCFDGGLACYGGSIPEAYRQAGVYAARILKGDKAGELPVQQVTKVEFIINLKTAKALGVNVSLPLLGRADEVIE